MQISRTTLSQPPTQKQKSKVLKPLEEKWTVGDQTFESTAELLARANDFDNASATYHYRAQDKVLPFTRTEKIKNAAGVGLMYAGAGAGIGALAGGGLVFLHGMASILNALLMGPSTGTPNGIVAIPVAIGAGVGATIGAIKGYNENPNVTMETSTGVLKTEDGKTNFYPGGDVTNKINLNEFDKAVTPPISAKEVGEVSGVRSRLTAAAAGAFMVPWTMIPILGTFTPPLVGASIGSTFDTRTKLGAGLGLTAGIGITAASIASMASGGYAPVALAGGLALGGAVLGKKIAEASSVVPAQRNYGEQWWNEQERSRDAGY